MTYTDSELDSSPIISDIRLQLEDAVERESVSQVRTATIVLTTFNMISAVTMAARIVYFAKKDRNLSLSRPPEGIEKGGGQEMGHESAIVHRTELEKPWWRKMDIPSGDVYPFILGLAIVLQGIIFLAAESRSIDGKNIEGKCGTLSEATWAAIWITPYLSLVFTAECLTRAFGNPSFSPRRPSTTIMCVLLTGFMVLVTWIPARTWKTPAEDICDGQLMSFVNQFSAGGLALSAVLLPMWSFMVVGIWMSLGKHLSISLEDRLAALKIIVYCLLMILQWSFVVPFFATSSVTKMSKPVAFMTTIVLNMSGILASVVHHYFYHYSIRLLYLTPGHSLHLDPNSSLPTSPKSPLLEKRLADFDFSRSPIITTPPPTYSHRDDRSRRQGILPDTSPRIKLEDDDTPSISRSRRGLTWASRRTGRWKEEVLAILGNVKSYASSVYSSRYSTTEVATISGPTETPLPPPHISADVRSLPGSASVSRSGSISAASTKTKSRARYSMFPPTSGLPATPRRTHTGTPPLPFKRAPFADPLPSTVEPTSGPVPRRPSRDHTPPMNTHRKESCTGTVSIGMILTPEELGGASPTLGRSNPSPTSSYHSPSSSNNGKKKPITVAGYKFPPPPMEKAQPPEWATTPPLPNGIRRGSEASDTSVYSDSPFV